MQQGARCRGRSTIEALFTGGSRVETDIPEPSLTCNPMCSMLTAVCSIVDPGADGFCCISASHSLSLYCIAADAAASAAPRGFVTMSSCESCKNDRHKRQEEQQR